jgi:hypothetical protein
MRAGKLHGIRFESFINVSVEHNLVYKSWQFLEYLQEKKTLSKLRRNTFDSKEQTFSTQYEAKY